MSSPACQPNVAGLRARSFGAWLALPLLMGRIHDALAAAKVPGGRISASMSASGVLTQVDVESQEGSTHSSRTASAREEVASKRLDAALSQVRQKRLVRGFDSLLDHNEDGVVTRWEAAMGILSLGERRDISRESALRLLSDPKTNSGTWGASMFQHGSKYGSGLLRRDKGEASSRPHAHLFDSCQRPERVYFDTSLFLDCVTARARYHLEQGRHPDETMVGQTELLSLHTHMGMPDDVPPPNLNVPHGVTCDEARAKGFLHVPTQCHSLVAAGFCNITCRDFARAASAIQGKASRMHSKHINAGVSQFGGKKETPSMAYEESVQGLKASAASWARKHHKKEAPSIDYEASAEASAAHDDAEDRAGQSGTDDGDQQAGDSNADNTEVGSSNAEDAQASTFNAEDEQASSSGADEAQVGSSNGDDVSGGADSTEGQAGQPDDNGGGATDDGGDPFGDGVPILASSDWHMEPWFDTVAVDGQHLGAGGGGDQRVSRYRESTEANMWKCKFDGTAPEVPCKQSGHNDPPYTHHEAMLDAMMKAAKDDKDNALMFVLGDLQPHAFNSSAVKMDIPAAVKAVASKAVGMLLGKVHAEQIFIAAGNHDGPEDSIFCEGGDEDASLAWADVMIENGVVNNELSREYFVNGSVEDTISLFRKTGYYIKALDNPGLLGHGIHDANLYAIVLNTNLGRYNMRQTRAFKDDLDWVKAQNGGAYVLGHHNSLLEDGTMSPIIPQEYTDWIKGLLAGNKHSAADTTDQLFTQVGAASPGGAVREQDVMFFMTKITNQDHELNWNLVRNGAHWAGQADTLPSATDWTKLPGDPEPDSPTGTGRAFVPN